MDGFSEQKHCKQWAHLCRNAPVLQERTEEKPGWTAQEGVQEQIQSY
jgi:hypothetical protein